MKLFASFVGFSRRQPDRCGKQTTIDVTGSWWCNARAFKRNEDTLYN